MPFFYLTRRYFERIQITETRNCLILAHPDSEKKFIVWQFDLPTIWVSIITTNKRLQKKRYKNMWDFKLTVISEFLKTLQWPQYFPFFASAKRQETKKIPLELNYYTFHTKWKKRLLQPVRECSVFDTNIFPSVNLITSKKSFI